MDLSNIANSLGAGQLEDMLTKFTQGQHDQVPDSQVHQAYSQVAAQLPQDQFVQAAQAAFEKLTPQQREEFARQLQVQVQQQGIDAPSAVAASADPGALATAVGDVHAQQPNALQQMFAPGGVFSSPVAKAALLGITAFAAQRLTANRR